MPMTTIKLPVIGPFDPARLVSNLRSTSFGLPYTIFGSNIIVRSLEIGHKRVVTAVCFRKTEAGYALIAEVSHDDSSLAFNPYLSQLSLDLGHIFGIQDSMSECYAVLGSDPLFAPLIRRHHGFRMVRAPDVFETVFSVILGQQISVTAANAQRRRLLEHLSKSLSYKGLPVTVMTAAADVADTPIETFRRLGISRQKSRYLREAARWSAEGCLDRSTLDAMKDPEAIDFLRGIPGVGLWTAEVVLMRALGRMDIFPADDIGLQKAVQHLHQLDHRPVAAELKDIVQRWAGWRSYAALYLWMDSAKPKA